MGLFRDKGACSICSQSKAKSIKDGFICKNCVERGGDFLAFNGIKEKNLTIELVNRAIADNANYLEVQEQRRSLYAKTKTIGKYVHLDETNRLFVVEGQTNGSHYIIYTYDEVLGCEYVEMVEFILDKPTKDNASPTHGENKCTMMKARFSLKGYPYSTISVSYITFAQETNGFLYKNYYEQAQEIVSYFNQMIPSSVNKQPMVNATTTSKSDDVYEEIKKCKELLDMGIINEDEFQQKKKQLLGI